MIGRGRVVLGVAAAATLALITACSSSGGGTGSGSSNSGSKSGGASIPVGVIGSFSGVQASSEGGVPKVAQAWASSVNDAGGIGGHKIKLYVEDDAGNPAKAVTAVKTLVQQDKVVAIVGDTSNVDQTWEKYVQGAGVPVIGGIALNQPQFTNPDFFPTGTNGIALQYGLLQQAKLNGGGTYLLYCAESPQCKQGAALGAALAPIVGAGSFAASSVSASAPDYTAVCQKVKSSGAKTFSIADGADIVLRIAAACRQQGVTAKLVQIDGQVTSVYSTNSAVDGTVGIEPSFPFSDTSVPATKAYRNAVAKYAPSLGTQDGPISSYMWVAGKLFEAAVKASGATTAITPASVKQGLYALKGETLGGLTQPLTFAKDKPTVLNCWFTLGVQAKKFTSPTGLKTTCAPDAVISGVLSKLGG